MAFGVVSLGILGAAAFFLWPALRPDTGGAAGAVTVQVSMSGFSPGRITAQAGVPLTLRFVNKDSQFHTDGGGWHQFAIDDLGVDVKIAPESTREVTITPGANGSYEFYCDICCGGKENPYMVGTLAVGNPV
jgi:plastocyanin